MKENRPKGTSIKKQRLNEKNGTKKQKTAAESNPVYQRVQATPWPLHHSDTDDLKN